MAVTSLGQQLIKLGLFEVTQESRSEEWSEVAGRVGKDHANQWGEWVKGLLIDEFRSKMSGSVDVSRHYRAATQVDSRKCLVDTVGPDGKPAKTERVIQVRGEKLIWVWRVRANGSGLALISRHVGKWLGLVAKAHMIASSGGTRIPLGPNGLAPSGVIISPIGRNGGTGADNIASLPRERIG